MSKDDKKQEIKKLQFLARTLSLWRVEVYHRPIILEWIEKKYKEIIDELTDKIIEEEKCR